jgi:uncharacterized protein (TIRG00374 family)
MSARRSTWRLCSRIVQIVVGGAAVWFLALPQAPAAWAAARALTSMPIAAIAGAGLCALTALVAYAQLLRVALDTKAAPGLWRTLGIITTSLGISNVLPAGSAAGTVVTFRMLERAGVPRSRAAVAMTVTSVGSAVVLNILLGFGLIALLPSRGLARGAIAAVPAALVIGSVVLLIRSILRGGPRVRASAGWLAIRFPRIVGQRAIGALDSLADELAQWRAEPARVRRAVIWAIINWIVDAAGLWVALLAVGVRVDPIVALVAFALAHIAGMLPVTPGGLGVVELTLAATLVGFGTPPAPTALGVALYRIFNYWLPIPAAAVASSAALLHPPAVELADPAIRVR